MLRSQGEVLEESFLRNKVTSRALLYANQIRFYKHANWAKLKKDVSECSVRDVHFGPLAREVAKHVARACPTAIQCFCISQHNFKVLASCGIANRWRRVALHQVLNAPRRSRKTGQTV
jgi:hypothetical protein